MKPPDTSTATPVGSAAPKETTIARRFSRLAIVNVLSNVTVPLAGLVDTAVLGRLPDIRFLAGVALASVLFDYIYWSFGFLRMATTGRTAQALGRDDQQGGFDVLYRSALLAVVVGLALYALQVPLRELGFLLLSGTEGVEAAGRDYFNARIWAAPVTLTNFALLGWYLGREEGGRALLMTAAANLTNVVGDYVLVLRLDFEATGAGWATVAGQLAMLFVGLALLPSRMPWSWSRVFERRELLSALQLNRDILLRTVALLTAFAVFTNLSSILGVVVLAANTILLRILSFASYLIDGIAFAIEGIAGNLWGAGRRDLLRKTLRLALVAALLCTAALGLALWLGPDLLLGLLTTHAPTVAAARASVPWLILVLLFGAPAYVLDGFFLGLSRGSLLRNSMIACLALGLLPVAAVAYLRADNDLLWLALTLFMALRVATLGLAARHELRPT